MSKARSLTLVLICALVVLPTDGEGAQNKREKWAHLLGAGRRRSNLPK